MMRKHDSIAALLEKLKTVINFNLLEIVDYWEGDLCAIGLKKDSKLVYISTYNYADEGEELLDYDFELIDEKGLTDLNVQKEVRGSNINAFVDDLKLFFEI